MRALSLITFFLIVQIQFAQGSFILNKKPLAAAHSDSSIINNSYPLKKILIVLGTSNDSIKSLAAGNELYNLLGHFNTSVNIISSKKYSDKTIKRYDKIFYVGLRADDVPSAAFTNDVYKSNKTIVWINSGFTAFENKMDVKSKFGFTVGNIDQTRSFNKVKSGQKVFTRGGNDIFKININNEKLVKIVAIAVGDAPGKTLPYIVKSKNLYYIADIPYFNCSTTDRYLLFADILHDILGENHREVHRAIVRIEDVTPVRDPAKLRNIADILFERHIPFLIGVVPFFVDPTHNVRISLSDKPELVAALHYCVSKGGSIVLHGVTHQYKGVSAVDFEFWDGTLNKPITNETEIGIENKIEKGINECVKNGIYPLYWETPHYTASAKTYKVVSKHFSSTIERILVTNSFKYGQFFPYEINRDIYGQKVIPEDLGYMPLLAKKDSSMMYVNSIISNAKELLNVRDGYASFFFHTFVNLDYLKEIADGISNLGYKFIDLRKETNWVKTNDLVILSGSQKYTLSPKGQVLTEIYYNKLGQVEKRLVTTLPTKSSITKYVILKPDEFYVGKTTIIQSKKNIAEKKSDKSNKSKNLNTTISQTHDKN